MEFSSDTPKPLVSIILPVYNRAQTLARCVESVRAQTFADWELVAVDDGSSDASAAALEAFADPRIRVLRHERNRGPGAARNTALRAARGEFVALIDSDDEWLPRKLEMQMAMLQAGECDLCGCEYWLIDGGRETLVALPDPASWAESLHTQCRLGNGTTLVVRQRVVQETGPLDEQLRTYEDWDWILRMTRRHRYQVARQPLARIHASGLRSSRAFAAGAERFLAKHDAEFARLGDGHRRRVRSEHFGFVAANALALREFRLGCLYLWKSFAAAPLAHPLRLAALLLAPVDACCGTSLIVRAAERLRRRREKPRPAP